VFVSSFSQISAEVQQRAEIASGSIRALVAEPDVASRRLIFSVLDDEPEMTIECVDDSELMTSIRESTPDLVIVDAHSAFIRHVRSWEALGIKSPAAAIITAYNSAALTPLACMAVDLLLKPFDVERFETALALAKAKIRRCRTEQESTNLSHEPDLPNVSELRQQRLAVQAGESVLLIKVEEIQWMQSAGKCVRVYSGNKLHVVRRSMRSLESLLDPQQFLRVHRNVIVNLDYVDEFHLPQKGNMFVKLRTGEALPLRKSTRSIIRKLLENRM
jgi:two-component system, LytTR family, response regulator